MREAIDKTATQQGTLINRDFLMGIQGFDNIVTTINPDGSIQQTNGEGAVKTIIFQDKKIVSTFTGEKTITKKTSIIDNQILEVLS